METPASVYADLIAQDTILPSELAQQATIDKNQAVFNDLERIKNSIVQSQTIANCDIISAEALCPGILMDNYPMGGYSGNNLKKAIASMEANQLLMVGGIIGAIIAIILGIIKAISLFFKGDAVASSKNRTETVNTNHEKVVTKVKEAAVKQRHIQEIRKEVSHNTKITDDYHQEFLDNINRMFGTNYTKTTPSEKVIEEVIDKATDDFSEAIKSIQCRLINELYKTVPSDGFNATLAKMIIEVPKVLDNVKHNIDYMDSFIDQPMDPRNVGGDVEPDPYKASDTFINLTLAIMKMTPTGDSADLRVLMKFMLKSEENDQFGDNFTIADAERWSENLCTYVKKFELHDYSSKANDLANRVDKLLTAMAKRQNTIPNEIKRDQNIRDFLTKARVDMTAVKVVLESAEMASETVARFSTRLLNALTRYIECGIAIEKFSVKMSKADEETHRRVKEITERDK